MTRTSPLRLVAGMLAAPLLIVAPACDAPDVQTDPATEVAADAVRDTLGGDRLRKQDGLDYIYYADEPMLPAYRLPTHVPLKGDSYDDFRASKPERYAITAPPAAGTYRPMTEWEPMQSIVMAVPSYLSGYGNADTTIVTIAKHAATVADVWFIVPNTTTKNAITTHLSQIGVSSSTINSKIKFLIEPLDSVWFIDSGPLPLLSNSGNSYAFADFRYYHNRVLDDGIPTLLGRELAALGDSGPTATYRMPLSTEGGTFQATSDGICFTGNRQLYYMSCDQGGCDASIRYMSLASVQNHPLAQQVREVWAEYAGCKDVIITNSITDDGTGHIDMYLKVLDDQRVMIGEYEAPYANSAQQTNAARMNANAAFIDAYVKPDGSTFEVERLVMPGHRNTSSGAVPFTYINSTFINGLNLWPAYTFPDWVSSRNYAESQWEAAMPGMDHIWIDSEELSFWSGAIHCITRTIPAASPGPWVADGTCSGGTCQAPAGGYSGACYPGGSSQQSCWGPEWLCTCNDCGGSCPFIDPGGGGVTGCGDITFEGCCDGATLQYCESGQVQGGHCSNGCGWDTGNGFYNCGQSGADPSGQNPLSCDDLGGCTPTCGANACGDDGCGGSCGACGAAETCQAGQCIGNPQGCGDVEYVGCCDGAQLKWCDNGGIQTLDCSSCGWNGSAGYYDCGQTGADPTGQNPLSCDDLAGCTPSCSGKTCGADGCGGVCGTCSVHEDCITGQCVAQCVPDCGGKDCGQDGCGGSCGLCGDGDFCSVDGECVPEACVPQCHNKQCGEDGCGGVCGACLANAACVAGQCVALCQPECTDKACGGDGCGGSCGGCTAGSTCSAAGQCVSSLSEVEETFVANDHMLFVQVVQTIPVAGFSVLRARVIRSFKSCVKVGSYVLLIVDPATACQAAPAKGSYWIVPANDTPYGASWFGTDLCGYALPVSEVTSPDAAFLLSEEADKSCN